MVGLNGDVTGTARLVSSNVNTVSMQKILLSILFLDDESLSLNPVFVIVVMLLSNFPT